MTSLTGPIVDLQQWAQALIEPIGQVVATELEAIDQAAELIAQRIRTGGRLITFGAGHSWCLAAELCSRAGGLPGVMAANLADIAEQRRDAWQELADSMPERQAALALPLAQHYDLAGRDSLIIVTNSARNAAAVELALVAKQLGCAVIAVVSRAHTDAVASRHPSGRKVVDLADVVLDNHGQAGDAAIEIRPGTWTGATSTIAGALVLQLLNCALVDRLASTTQPLRSANLDAAEDGNRR